MISVCRTVLKHADISSGAINSTEGQRQQPTIQQRQFTKAGVGTLVGQCLSVNTTNDWITGDVHAV
jgi:hypothetical protein